MLGGVDAGRVPLVHRDVAGLAGAVVEARHDPAVFPGVNDVRVFRITHRVPGFAPADAVPIAEADAPLQTVARPARAAEILHAPHDAVRHRVVGVHMIKLGDGQRRGEPRLAAVAAEIDAAVVGVDHPVGVFRVDPHVVVIAVMDAFHRLDALATVDGLQQRDLRGVEHVGVRRVNRERGVVPSPLPQDAVVAGQTPVFAAVVGTEQAPLLRFDDRVNPLAITRCHGDADFTPDAGWQAILAVGVVRLLLERLQTLPTVAAIAGHEQIAAGATAGVFPRLPPRLPETGEENSRVVRVESHIGRAGVLVDEADFRPRRTAVLGTVNPPLRVRPEGVPENRRVADVRVLRIDDNGADLPDLFPDVLPRLARVGRFEDPGARRDVAADVRFTGTNVDHIRVAGGHGDAADGTRRLVVEDRLPLQAAVGRLPDSTRSGRGIIRQRVADNPARPAHPPAGERPDAAIRERREFGRPVRLRPLGNGERNPTQNETDGEKGTHGGTRRIDRKIGKHSPF